MFNPFSKLDIDPKRELPVSIYDVLDKPEEGVVYEDMYISKDTFLNAVFISDSGVFCFIAVDKVSGDDKNVYFRKVQEIASFFEVQIRKLFVFFVSDEKSCVVMQDFSGIVEVEDVFSAFDAIYENLHRPSVLFAPWSMPDVEELLYEEPDDEPVPDPKEEGITMPSRILDEATKKRVEDICASCMCNERPGSGYKTIDGTDYICKDSSISFKGINTPFVGEKKWFRISDRDSIRTFWLTVLGGWSGIHRLFEGNIAAFLLYILTCGMGGVLYVADVFMYLTGNAGYNEVTYAEDEDGNIQRTKEKVFYRNIPKLTAFAGLCVSVILAIVAVRFVYTPMFGKAMDVVANAGMKAVNSNPETAEQSFGFLSGLLGQ